MAKTILAVLAHPDDETFGLGGTLALYARQGFNVYYACATGGEVGSADEEYMQGFKDTAEMRADELKRATDILGLKGVFFLGYRDSGMRGTEDNKNPDAQVNHPVDEVAGRIVKIIRELKADIVLTHDPIGGYRHPDHVHLHQATKLAFEKADDASFHPEVGAPFKPTALYYHVFPKGILKWAVRLMPLVGKDPTKFGRNGDVDLTDLIVDFPIHVRVDIRPVVEVKHRASAQHASQGGGAPRGGIMGFLMKLVGEREEFMRAYPPVTPSGFRRKSDLFDI